MSARMTKAELIEGWSNYLKVEHYKHHKNSKAYKFIVAARTAFATGDTDTLKWWKIYWKIHSRAKRRHEFLDVIEKLLKLMK